MAVPVTRGRVKYRKGDIHLTQVARSSGRWSGRASRPSGYHGYRNMVKLCR